MSDNMANQCAPVPSIFGAPGRYIQGEGVINEIGSIILPLGRRALVAGGQSGLRETREGREKSFEKYDIWQIEVLFGGETCDPEIERFTEIAKSNDCDVMLACGGGKVIDTVKAAAELAGLPAVIVPTVASNDAPCSALSIIHNEDGSFLRALPLKNSPAIVLVDTGIIACSPVRQLVSGMGDALATWYEANACMRSGARNNFGGSVTVAALALARACLDTLLEYGREAKQSCEKKRVTPALSKVVEANILLSGLGFESGGLAVAHAVYNAFSGIAAMHGYTHGEKVTFGTLVQMVLEQRPEHELLQIWQFCVDVGLPVRLSDLGLTGQYEEVLRAVALEVAAPGGFAQNLRPGLTEAEIYGAFMMVDGR